MNISISHRNLLSCIKRYQLITAKKKLEEIKKVVSIGQSRWVNVNHVSYPASLTAR